MSRLQPGAAATSLQTTAESLTNHLWEKTSRAHTRATSWIERAFVAAASAVMVFTQRVAAQQEDQQQCGHMPESIIEIEEFLGQLQSIGMAIAFALAAVLLVYAGVLFMTGDPAKQERAKKIIVNTVIGLIIVGLSGALVELVRNTICEGA